MEFYGGYYLPALKEFNYYLSNKVKKNPQQVRIFKQ